MMIDHSYKTHSGQTLYSNHYSLGSFRSVSGLLDGFVREKNSEGGYGREDYMRFYMGTSMISGRTDLGQIYALIFDRIKSLGFDWIYAFPHIYSIRCDGPRDDDSLNYDPSTALENEKRKLAQDKRDREIDEQLARGSAEAKKAAWDLPPPPTVQAYQSVFRKDPQGWPPDPDPQT